MHNAIYKFQTGIPREQGQCQPTTLLRGHRTANKKQVNFFFLVGLEELFCFAFVQVSMETSLLEMRSSSEPSRRMQAEDKPGAVIYLSAIMS